MVAHTKFLVAALSSSLAAGCYSGLENLPEDTDFRKLALNQIRLNGSSNADPDSSLSLVHNGLRWNQIAWNGLNWQGLRWNRISWNGINWNEINWNGISWNGINWNGTHWNDISIEGGAFVASDGDDEISGAELTGAAMEFVDDETGASVLIRFDDIYTSPTDDEVLYYQLSVLESGSDTWQPLCTDEQGDPTEAVVLAGIWDQVTGDRHDEAGFTFACRGYVLAKCVDWGYVPWSTATQCKDKKNNKDKKCHEVELRDHHQACTRMARADYCGDGAAHTHAGTLIDIADGLNPKINELVTDWGVEAEWNADGAYCMGDSLRLDIVMDDPDYDMPACLEELTEKHKNCGTLKKDRALLVNRFSIDATLED